MAGPLTQHIVHDCADPWLDKGYDALNQYFGVRGEMETRAVIEQRLGWRPDTPINGYALRYEMVILADADGAIAAVRDHCVVLALDAIRVGVQAAVVHLSHIWIDPRWQGQQLTRRLHDAPILAARAALADAGSPATTAIILAAEVEPYQADDRERIGRLRAFQRAQYQPADPERIPFVQPDFRVPAVIDANGGPQPLPLILMLWRVGRESEPETTAGEIRHIVHCLYAMYGHGMDPRHMQAAYDTLAAYPPDTATVRLSWDTVFKPA